MAAVDGVGQWSMHCEGSRITPTRRPAVDIVEVHISITKLRSVLFVNEDGVRVGNGEVSVDSVLRRSITFLFPFSRYEQCIRGMLINILSFGSVPRELQRDAVDLILWYASRTYSPQETPSVIRVQANLEYFASEVHVLAAEPALDLPEEDWDWELMDETLVFDIDAGAVNNLAAPKESIEKLRDQCSFFCDTEVQNQNLGDCLICLDGLHSGEDSMRLIKMPCSHVFHESCLVRWLEMKNTCPLCRFIIN